ncbi:MAG: hypothetical protein M1831_002122 [Alyxoria varia]|nr:MAG: hypothetical protein M1831_002122 [Alyxoria varia]
MPATRCMQGSLPLRSLRGCNSRSKWAKSSSSRRRFTTTRQNAKELRDAYIISAARTPVGMFNGSLATVPAPTLASTAIAHALSNVPTLPRESITSAYIGNVLPAGVGQSPARQSILQPPSSLPSHIDTTTINKVCSSGLKAVTLASQQIALGIDSVALAGGTESMSRVPYYVPRGPQFPAFGEIKMKDGMISDGLWDPHNDVHMGVCAEKTSRDHNISREAQDEYAIQSYKRAQQAWADGSFADEIAPVTVPGGKKGDVVRKEDEGYNRLKLEKVPTLKPAFEKGGTVTAANSSSFNDGASALALASADVACEHAQKGSNSRLARIVSHADAAVAPIDFPVAPASAIPLALSRAGNLSVSDIAAWEINEAFAAVVLANARLLGLEGSNGMERVNAWGGAIALGHAIGSSGSRILTTLLSRLRVGEFGVAGICNGGGAATAVVVQRVDHV